MLLAPQGVCASLVGTHWPRLRNAKTLSGRQYNKVWLKRSICVLFSKLVSYACLQWLQTAIFYKKHQCNFISLSCWSAYVFRLVSSLVPLICHVVVQLTVQKITAYPKSLCWSDFSSGVKWLQPLTSFSWCI